MSRFTKVLTLGAVTAGLLAVSAGSALATNRHISSPPQSATVSAASAAQVIAVVPEGRHTS
jgi:hypothetical protein